MTSAIKVGEWYTWRHVPRGGYGFITHVSVKVISIGKKLIRVEAPLRGGGTKRVNISPRSLIVTTAPDAGTAKKGGTE